MGKTGKNWKKSQPIKYYLGDKISGAILIS